MADMISEVKHMIAVSSDHAGYDLKCEIIAHLDEMNIPYSEMGCMDGSSFDYPLAAEEACNAILSGKADMAVLICGTGIGISMAANKFKGIRAAVCTNEYSAEFSRRHNDANVLCLGERVTGKGLACKITDTFIKTGFEGGRHSRRLDMIADIENKQ